MNPEAKCFGAPRLTDKSTVAVFEEVCRRSIVAPEAAVE